MKLGRPSKFGAVRTTVNGVGFASAKESRRWSDLLLRQKAGEITELERQVRYPLTAHGKTIGHIVPDFRYRERGVLVVEDVKSPATITSLFLWKAKHFHAQYGFEIKVVI